MTGRERFLAALNNQKPDRMPCQVHSWMEYYLRTYLNGMDQFAAYEYFGMDPVIYVGPDFLYDEARSVREWQIDERDLGILNDGYHHREFHITTPGGKLVEKTASNQYTTWHTEYIIKTPEDFELWKKYYPRPVGVDWTPVIEAKKRIGDRGIVRDISTILGNAVRGSRLPAVCLVPKRRSMPALTIRIGYTAYCGICWSGNWK